MPEHNKTSENTVESVNVLISDPRALYESLMRILVKEDATPHPHANGDCQLITTDYRMNGCVAWAVRVEHEKKAYPVLLSVDELKEIAKRAKECAKELERGQ